MAGNDAPLTMWSPIADAFRHYLNDSLGVICHGDDLELLEGTEKLTRLTIPSGVILPASGTGSIAVLGRRDLEDWEKLLPFDFEDAHQALEAEREFFRQADPEREKGCGASAYVAKEVFSLEVTIPGDHYNVLTRRRTVGDMEHYVEIICEFIRSLGLGKATERKAG